MSLIGLTGPWTKTVSTLLFTQRRLGGALRTAVAQEAHFYRRKIIEGLREQAPGGKRFKPLSPATLAVRRFMGFGGTKALIRTGSLRNSVTVRIVGDGAFVGILRTARGKNGQSLANIADIHEHGAGPYLIVMTDKMRRFLAAAFARAGLLQSGSRGSLGGGSRWGVLVIRIPPRPFLQPVFDKYGGIVGRERFIQRVVNLLGGGPMAWLFGQSLRRGL